MNPRSVFCIGTMWMTIIDQMLFGNGILVVLYNSTTKYIYAFTTMLYSGIILTPEQAAHIDLCSNISFQSRYRVNGINSNINNYDDINTYDDMCRMLDDIE